MKTHGKSGDSRCVNCHLSEGGSCSELNFSHTEQNKARIEERILTLATRNLHTMLCDGSIYFLLCSRGSFFFFSHSSLRSQVASWKGTKESVIRRRSLLPQRTQQEGTQLEKSPSKSHFLASISLLSSNSLSPFLTPFSLSLLALSQRVTLPALFASYRLYFTCTLSWVESF